MLADPKYPARPIDMILKNYEYVSRKKGADVAPVIVALGFRIPCAKSPMRGPSI
jgi:hypothetical protein